ncbi:MAG: class IV adenylate cyclase [Planctomycetes bacterium]|nr:class IV adenylate cyclase [Planctomycetota bacterium]
MPSNIEIKARVRDFTRMEEIARRLADSREVLDQEDTFFKTENGRLKLRQITGRGGELIFYERPDVSGPKQSNYLISPTKDTRGLLSVLSGALPLKGVVRKRRQVFFVGQTRIHLDEVEGLGHYMELEVVLKEGQEPEEGRAIAGHLMRELGVEDDDLIDRAYIDLIHEKSSEARPST